MLMATRRILVVGNYPADQQQSMARFADLLVRIYQPHGQVQLLRPPVLVGGIPGLPSLVRKYLAYIDKLVLFPFWLALRARTYQVVHIADHSNAFYAFCCPRRRCIVTCHDLLALRGAMGDRTVACEPSHIGIWLQRLILVGLRHTLAVAFISKASQNDFHRFVGRTSRRREALIPNPLNAPFNANLSEIELTAAERSQLPQTPYLLMVGSASPRKNRVLALRLVQQLGAASPYRVVLAGGPLAPEEQAFITAHQLSERVVSIVRPSHALLNHLYGRAHALLFPSYAEGFGWPLIEAQASGCPVIASTTTSIPEVAGSAAFYADPDDVQAFSSHVLALEDPAQRRLLVQLGFENLRRFDPGEISRQYVRFALQPA
jgi:glycosyltransferase involved in cell wall biosynthesis